MLNPYRTHLGRWSFAVALGISAVILFTPESGVPNAPPGTDKVVHLVLFATLAITGRAAGLRSLPLLIGLAWYAALSEALQGLLPLGRSADPMDAVVDFVGAVAGWALTVAIRKSRVP